MVISSAWDPCIELQSRRQFADPKKIEEGCELIEEDMKKLAEKWGLRISKFRCKRQYTA